MDAIRRNKRCSSPLACHTLVAGRGAAEGGGGSCNGNTSMRHITSKLNYGHADASTKATNKLSIKAAQKYATSAARGTGGTRGEAAATGREVSEIEGVLYVPQPSKCDKVWHEDGNNIWGDAHQRNKYKFAPVHNELEEVSPPGKG